MDWLKKMNVAIKYIEDNLQGDIDYAELARIVCCSSYHFQRIFSFMAGVPLSEYIRRRRLTIAAFELQNSDVKVIDLAIKSGYESPTAFTRAFQNIHGISPNAARESGRVLKAYPPISFQISIKGAVEMNYKIVKKEAFRVVGVKLHTTMENEESFSKIPAFWGETTQSGRVAQIASLMTGEPFGLLGISMCNEASENSDFDYFIASTSNLPVPENMFEATIPEATWAVFECIGAIPFAIQDLQKRIMTEWLPISGYDYGNAPDIEVYSEGDVTSANYKSEVWFPIVKK